MYCHKCGTKLNNNVEFCTECGAKIDRSHFSEENADEQYRTGENYSAYKTDSGGGYSTQHTNNDYSQQPYNTTSEQAQKTGCGKYLAVLQIIAIIIGIIWLNTDSGKIAVTDMTAYLDGGETYINMIKTSDVKFINTTYGAFVNEMFYDCNWSYFKSDSGDRIVELNCRDRTNGSLVCIQFMITPIGNDLYYIEPCFMSIDGYSIGDILSWLYSML